MYDDIQQKAKKYIHTYIVKGVNYIIYLKEPTQSLGDIIFFNLCDDYFDMTIVIVKWINNKMCNLIGILV